MWISFSTLDLRIVTALRVLYILTPTNDLSVEVEISLFASSNAIHSLSEGFTVNLPLKNSEPMLEYISTGKSLYLILFVHI